MSRLGPLSVVDEVLVIGDHLGYHAHLTDTGISHGPAAGERVFFAWDDITSATLHLPTTSFRYPGLLATVGFAALVALVMGHPGLVHDHPVAAPHLLVGQCGCTLYQDRCRQGSHVSIRRRGSTTTRVRARAPQHS